MAWYVIVLLFLIGGPLLYAAFEKILEHRLEMERVKSEVLAKRNDTSTAEMESLRREIAVLKERLDEQAILLDDVQRLTPPLEQRING